MAQTLGALALSNWSLKPAKRETWKKKQGQRFGKRNKKAKSGPERSSRWLRAEWGYKWEERNNKENRAE